MASGEEIQSGTRQVSSQKNKCTVFAQRVWGKSWADVFATDVTEEFTPNDFEMHRPDWFVARRRRAISKLKDFAHQMLLDPALAVEAP